ncbi:hypothetical protein SGPA1_50566 [Streptomyces misionensis JCM 4497]
MVVGRRAAGGAVHLRRGGPGPAGDGVPAVGAGGGRVGGGPRRPCPRPGPEAGGRHRPPAHRLRPARRPDVARQRLLRRRPGRLGRPRVRGDPRQLPRLDRVRPRVDGRAQAPGRPDRAGGRGGRPRLGGLLRPGRPRPSGPHRRLLGRLPHPPRPRHPAGRVGGRHRGRPGRGLRDGVPRRDGGPEGHGPHPAGRHPGGGPGALRGVLAAHLRRPGQGPRLHLRGRQRPPLPHPADRQLRQAPRIPRCHPRGLPLRRRPRLPGRRRAHQAGLPGTGLRQEAPVGVAPPERRRTGPPAAPAAGPRSPGRPLPSAGPGRPSCHASGRTTPRIGIEPAPATVTVRPGRGAWTIEPSPM